MTEWQNVPDKIDDYTGFVYLITNLENGRYYIGQKKFWSNKALKALKGRKNKRHKITESNWRSYWGSSKELLEDIQKYGKDKFTRRMIHICKSKSQMNYLETMEQFNHKVLFDKMSYNKIINCRISANQLQNYPIYP